MTPLMVRTILRLALLVQKFATFLCQVAFRLERKHRWSQPIPVPFEEYLQDDK